VRQIIPPEWKPKIRHLMLDVDSRIDSTLFSSGKGLRELYERYSTFMDRFYVGRWKRWVFIEPLSEAATIGLGGLVLLLALAVPAFRETADEDWLKKSDLAVSFLDRYGNPIGSRGIKHNDSIPLEDFPDNLIKATLATEDRRFYDHFGIDIAGTARALLTNPTVLLMDEPTEGLAPVLVETLTAVLAKLRVDNALSIILVEQNSRVALTFSTRTVILDKGRIVYDGASEPLRADPDRLAKLIGIVE